MRTYEETLDYYGKLVYDYEKITGTRMKNTSFIVPEILIELYYKVHVDKLRKDIRETADSIEQ